MYCNKRQFAVDLCDVRVGRTGLHFLGAKRPSARCREPWCRRCDNVTGEESVRESRRGNGDSADYSVREDERVRTQQGWNVEEGAGHSVQPEHPVHVEERVHARVLARPQVDELVLHTGQTDETRTRTQDVRQGTIS